MTTDGWQVLVAFNNGAQDDITAITTIGAAGDPLAGLAPTVGAHNVWTDITQYVQRITTSRGRQHELSRFEAGRCTVDLVNLTAVFNPWNTSSPFYGLLLPMKPLRVQRTYLGTTYVRYTGYVTAWPMVWPNETYAGARIEASDAFRSFSLANITSTRYKQQILGLGPRTYYRLGELLATSATDSANGRNATYVNCNQGVQGALVADEDNAVDISTSGYLQAPGAAGVGASSGLTVEAWFNLAQYPTGAQSLILYNSWYSTTEFFKVFVSPGGSAGQVYLAAMSVTNSGHSLDIGTFTGITAALNTWHHVVVTLSADGLTCKIYGDGVLIKNAPQVGSALLTFRPSDVLIGADRQSGDQPVRRSFPGSASLDEVALYDFELTAAQVLANYNAGVGQWANQQSGARVSSILDVVGWATAARSISTGQSTLQPVTTSLAATKALSHLQTVEETEAGALFMTGDGKVKFQDRSAVVTTHVTPVVVLGDGAGQQPYRPAPDLALDDLDIWNESVVQRDGGAAQMAQDAASQAAYGRRTLSRTGLLNTTDAESLYHAQWDMGRYPQPITRVRRVQMRLTSLPPTLPAVLGAELLDKVTFGRNSLPGGGSSFSQNALIEGMEEEVDISGDWTLTWRLSSTDATPYWVVGDSSYSVLGSTTRLGF